MKRYIHDEHVIFTPENPMHPTVHGKNPSIEEVTQFLRGQGENAEIIHGHYDQPERSILINSPKNVNGLHQMAKDFGQDSLIHSKGGKHSMKFLNGEKAGTEITGQGTKFMKEKPDNYYSTIHTEDGPLHFQHNFDFGKSEELKKAPTPFNDYRPDQPETAIPDFDNEDMYKKLKSRVLPNGLVYNQYIHKANKTSDNGRVHSISHPQHGTLAYMSTEHEEDPMAEGGKHLHKVSWAEVDPDYRGHGLGRQMYLATLLHGTGRLSSDSRISPEAHKMWKKMKGTPGLGGKIARYPKPGEDLSDNSLQASYENDRHQVFVRDPKKLDMNAMFPKVNFEEKLAANEDKKKFSLERLRATLETPHEIESIDIPEHTQMQWAVPMHRWQND